MKYETVRTMAFAMPLTNPAFPPGPYRFINREYFIIQYRTGIAAAVPQMKKQRWGRIINVAAAHGLVGSTHKAAYVAAKHGLIGLTKVVGLETAAISVDGGWTAQ